MTLSRSILTVISTAISFVFCMGAQAEVQPLLQWQNISYAGTGCPQGSLTVENGNLVLSAFSLEVKSNSAAVTAVKSCNVVLPTQGLPGFQVGLKRPTVEGLLRLKSSKSKVTFSSEIFTAGAQGVQKTAIVKGPANIQDLSMDWNSEEDISWAPCGQAANLRLNLNVNLAAARKEKAAVVVEALAASAGTLLTMRTCQ